MSSLLRQSARSVHPLAVTLYFASFGLLSTLVLRCVPARAAAITTTASPAPKSSPNLSSAPVRPVPESSASSTPSSSIP